MLSLITRLRDRLADRSLNGPIDLNGSAITQEHDGAITVTEILTPLRRNICVGIALVCSVFLIAVSFESIFALAFVSFFCIPVVLLALFIGGAFGSKSIDCHRKQATRSFRFFSYSTEVTEPLATQGVIKLSYRWESDDSGGSDSYTITLFPGTGLLFSTTNDYPTARAFAERLAGLLHFPLEDRVPQRHWHYEE